MRGVASFLVLLFVVSPVFGARPAEPVNGDAMPEARRIMDYLSSLRSRYDRRVVAGAAGSADPGFTLLSSDYGYPRDVAGSASPRNRASQNRMLIEHWKSGGLVMLGFLARNPWTGGSAWDRQIRDLDEVVTPGTAANTAWMRELDSAAAGLSELRDAGVVVLWRPLQDMNGDSFWWGRQKGAEFRRDGFVKLWRQMYDYFTHAKKLNNLLWVYSASAASHRNTSATAYYPGSEYCDIVGLDCYSSDFFWDGYGELVLLNKPFGVTELGRSPEEPGAIDAAALMKAIRFWYPLTTFFSCAEGISIGGTPDGGGGLPADPWVLPRNERGWAASAPRRWRSTQALAVNKVDVLTEAPVCWKRVDLRINLAASFETPFDPAQIEVDARFTTPSGATMTVPAFFDQRFERQIWGGGRFSEEMMVEAGAPEWRVRFMPTEPGAYRCVVRAKDRSGVVESAPVSFKAQPASGPGYIRVSQKDPHYFEFDDGSPFFAIGMNVVEHPLSEYYRYIPQLAENGANFSRLWIGFEYFGLELGSMGDYRLDNAWRLDRVMELSEHYGIYQKLCIDWIRHITPRGEPRRTFDPPENAYSISNGGPCRDMKDFFTSEEARRLFRNRLRYIVARWGYSPNVMAWELWNEIDLIDPKAADQNVIAAWNREMCRYLKSIDPWQHLTTNSLGGRSWAKTIWTLDENQFAQRHGYSTPSPRAVQAHADMAANVLKWLDDVSGFNKPYLMAEFGLQRDRMDIRAICDRDQEGVHMHNGIWAALAHGSAGTAQLWWWGQYVDPKNLYFHFRAVADFAKGIAWNTAGFERAEIETPGETLRAVGLRGKRISIVWLQNTAHTWWNVVNGSAIPEVEPSQVKIAGYPDGRYRVEYWNTYNGVVESAGSALAGNGVLTLPTPSIATDVAVKIFPEH
jgi:hypothetical protein